MYKLFSANAEFEKFAVKDLLSRAINSIKTIREDTELDPDDIDSLIE